MPLLAATITRAGLPAIRVPLAADELAPDRPARLAACFAAMTWSAEGLRLPPALTVRVEVPVEFGRSSGAWIVSLFRPYRSSHYRTSEATRG